MFLTEEEKKPYRERVEKIKYLVELLESTKTTQSEYITDKQYQESGMNLSNQVLEIEIELGLAEAPKSEQLSLIDTQLTQIERWLTEYGVSMDQQMKSYDEQVHDLIEEIDNERSV